MNTNSINQRKRKKKNTVNHPACKNAARNLRVRSLCLIMKCTHLTWLCRALLLFWFILILSYQLWFKSLQIHSSPRFFRRNGSTRGIVDYIDSTILMDVLQEREIFIDKLKRQERRVNEWNMLIQK